MLRMPPFDVHTPKTAEEAVRLHAELPDAMYIAGGTDLLPNLKHQLHTPKHLVALSELADFDGIGQDADGALRIGAGTSLHTVATSDSVGSAVPALAQAAASVAGPQHRRMGTLGGNVMLDTRCLFYNQSLGWRQALGYCLKKDGELCHVIGSKKTCVAANSADTPPVLIAVGAAIEVRTPEGLRTVKLADLYHQDGRYDAYSTLSRGDLVTAIVVPAQPTGHRSTYRKLRARGAVDFPQLGLALAGDFDADGTVKALTCVVSAVMPKPKVLRGMDDAVGTKLEDDVIDAVAERVFKQVRPQASIHGSQAWRRHMARVEAKRGLRTLRG